MLSKFNRLLYPAGCIILLLLAGCRSGIHLTPTIRLPTPSLSSINTATTVKITPVTTWTATPSSTITKPLSRTPTLTVKPPSTWTPLPTIPTEEAGEFIVDLYVHNMNCKLPCWWGAVPGVTSWESVEQFLNTFVAEITTGEDIPGLYGIQHHGIHYKILDNPSPGSTGYFVRDGTIYKLVISPEGTELSYQLNQLLATYGEPDEILLQGWPYNDDRQPHFALLIIYDQKGILARYQGDAEFTSTQKMRMCPKKTGPKLILWAPGFVTVESLIAHENEIWSAPDFQPIQDTTNLDVKAFYQKMLDPEACFETPKDIWDNMDFGATATPIPSPAPK